MRAGKITYFAPDGADFCGLAAVETLALVEDATTHRLFLNIVIVTVDECAFLFKLFFGVLCLELLLDCVECLGTLVLVAVAGSSNFVCLCIALLVYLCAELFVVLLVAVFAFYCLANLFHQLHLRLAVNLDSLVGNLHRFEQVVLGYLFHFALYHHNVIVCGCNHDVHVCILKLCECGVNNELAVDACYAYF